MIINYVFQRVMYAVWSMTRSCLVCHAICIPGHVDVSIVTAGSCVHDRWSCGHDFRIMRLLVWWLVCLAFMTVVMRSWHVCHANINIIPGESYVHDCWVMRILVLCLAGETFITAGSCGYIGIVTGRSRVHDWWVMRLYWYRDWWVTRSCPVGMRPWLPDRAIF